MGGGLAGPELAAAVAEAGGLGTLGLAPHTELRESITRVRECAPGRAVAVNLLTPFLRRSHVSVCVRARVEAAVVAFGGDRELVDELRAAGIFVLVMVGTPDQARRAIGWGADGLIAQGGEAGGHLSGTTEALQFLPRALAIADGRPVLLAGGIATAADTQAALAAGASGVIAGTRFLLTHESRAHPKYQRRVLAADKTLRTMLFGLGWPAPHRVIPNAATERWCNGDGTAKPVTRAITRGSAFLAKFPADDLGPEAAESEVAVVLPDRPDRRNACVGGRPRSLLCGTERAADDVGHIGQAGVDGPVAGRTIGL